MEIIEDINFLLKTKELKNYIKKENIITYTKKGETFLHFSKGCFMNSIPYEEIDKITNKHLFSLTEINFDVNCKDCLTIITFEEEGTVANSHERGLMVLTIANVIRQRQNLIKLLKEYKETFSKSMTVKDITSYFENLQPLLIQFESGLYPIPVPELHNHIEVLSEDVNVLLKENNVFFTGQEMLESLTETAVKALMSPVLNSINSSPVILTEEIKENVKTLEKNIVKQYRSNTKVTVLKKEWLTKKLKYGKSAFFIQCETYNEVLYLKNADLMVLPTIILKGLLATEGITQNNLTNINGYEIDALSKDEFETMNTLIATTPSVKRAYMIAETI